MEDRKRRVLEGVGDGSKNDEAKENEQHVANARNLADSTPQDDTEDGEVESICNNGRQKCIIWAFYESENLSSYQRV